VKLTRSCLNISVRGRTVTVQGEGYLPGHGSPDFVVYSNTIEEWDDGSEISEEEKREVLQQIEQEARSSGLRIEIE
jgi:hypothetical protein